MKKTNENPVIIKALGAIMNAFQTTLARLARCIRWEGYENRIYRQSSLDHSFSLALLTAYCVQRERDIGGVTLDGENLITHALLHDFAEGLTGDVTYRFKNDPRIKAIYSRIEHEETMQSLASFGDLFAAFFRATSTLPKKSVESRFFDAMERLDYIIYALNEYLHGNTAFASVLNRQHAALTKHAQEFLVINELYPPKAREWIEKQISKHKASVTKTNVVTAQPKHIDDVVACLNDLIDSLVKSGENRDALVEKAVAGIEDPNPKKS